MNWKLRKAFTGNNTSDVQTINGYIAAGEDNDFSVEVSPVGKEYPAPLVVPRTNLLIQSNQFDTTWGSTGTTLTGGQAGYDGSNDAWKMEKTAAAYRQINQSVSSSGVNTFSVYAKAGTLDIVSLFFRDAASDDTAVKFNLVTQGVTVQSVSNYISHEMVDIGGGWFRCSMTYNHVSGDLMRIYPDFEETDAGYIYIQDAQLEAGDKATEYIPTTTEAVTRSWDSFSRVQNQVPGICNGIHTHTGAASGGGIAATTLTGTGSGGKFKYEFDTLGKLVLIEADDAGQGYRVDDKLSITTNEGHDIEFRLVEGSNATTVTVGMEATKPSKPVPFPVTKMRVADSTDRQVLIMDQRSRYVFPKPTPYLLDTYEGAAAAYSLRRLRSAYTGPAVRVRRASNNDELDIYFDGQGNLDTASLEAFCAGTNGFVKVWYDQGPIGNNAEQTVTANQPLIISSGSLIQQNEKPALSFIPFDNFPFDNSGLDIGSMSSFTVGTFTNISGSQMMLGLSGGVANRRWYAPYLVSGNFNYGYGANATFMNTTADTNQNLHTLIAGSTLGGIESFLNSSSVGTQATLGSGIDVTNSGFMKLGTSFYTTGNLQEIIIYNSDQSSNRTGIETNINDYYNIY